MEGTNERGVPQTGNLVVLAKQIQDRFTQGRSISDTLEPGLRPDRGWIGVENVLSNRTSTEIVASPAYNGLERRQGKAVTLPQLATRLGWRENDVALEASRGAIWGARKIGTDWFFDPTELRRWFDDRHNGEIRMHV